MKIIFFILSIFLMSFSCDNVSLKDEIKMIEFNSGGMSGYHEQIKISEDSIEIIIEQRRTEEPAQKYQQEISPEDWSKLIETIENLNFSEIGSLESPTMKRAYDGAMHSGITIYTLTSSYVSPSFDDDNPHEKLQPLMNAIREVAGKVERRD